MTYGLEVMRCRGNAPFKYHCCRCAHLFFFCQVYDSGSGAVVICPVQDIVQINASDAVINAVNYGALRGMWARVLRINWIQVM